MRSSWNNLLGRIALIIAESIHISHLQHDLGRIRFIGKLFRKDKNHSLATNYITINALKVVNLRKGHRLRYWLHSTCLGQCLGMLPGGIERTREKHLGPDKWPIPKAERLEQIHSNFVVKNHADINIMGIVFFRKKTHKNNSPIPDSLK